MYALQFAPRNALALALDYSTATPCHHDTKSYVDSVCGSEAGGEDSSYDSDYEVEEIGGHHHDVSRTVSDTLAAEFAEYVTDSSGCAGRADYVTDSRVTDTGGYTARVEFGLKLGYTERNVQAALQKLGTNPGQNELLAELIKLGAQSPRVGGEECGEDSTDLATPAHDQAEELRFRPVVIDGSNVAMSHGNKEVFSCRGIQLCVDWFKARGHKEITVFVPKWRKEASRPDNPITEQDILSELERDRLLVFTPSRLVGGKRMVCYDDRYILRLAAEVDGIVVSNDNYRDLAQESPEFRKVVEERILMYSFVNDRFMPPDDPLGRSGPTLDNFLRISTRRGDPPPPCPYAKKCTYGNKCKFHHPERGPLPHKSVTERLIEHAQRQLQARASESFPGKQLKGKSLSLPLQSSSEEGIRKAPLARTKSNVPPSVATAVAATSEEFRSPPPGYSWNTGATWEPEGPNLHRKLQRQLTLNPACDPRLYQLMSHQAVGRHMSLDRVQYQAHPGVTRIASAPPSHPAPQPRPHPHLLPTTSDPQLNMPQMWPLPPPLHPEEARRKLHYHLAAIFPDEQVRAAMHLYPNETNPQTICAAILAMFPSKQ